MEPADQPPFSPAVQRLFELPEPGWAEPPARWRDYAEQDGVTSEDVADLIEVATDPLLLGAETDASDDVLDLAELNWAAPVHAWRALARLRAEAAIEPLVRLVSEADDWDTDWIHQELPDVYAELGAPAVPVLLAHLDQAGHPDDAYLAWVEGLALLGNRWPDQREAVVAALTEQLAQFETNSPVHNAFFVFALVKLKATGVAPLMAEAFGAGRVDEAVAGNWDDAQILMGLKEPDAAFHARERARLAKLQHEEGFDDEPGANPPRKPTAAEKAKKKAKAKAAKAARKKNRKK
jgi:hypothetical protein